MYVWKFRNMCFYYRARLWWQRRNIREQRGDFLSGLWCMRVSLGSITSCTMVKAHMVLLAIAASSVTFGVGLG